MRPAAFLDRDGVICEYVDHLHKVEDFKLRIRVGEAIMELNKAGYLVFVITNQPMIAKGFLTIEGLTEIHRKMQQELAITGAKLDAIEFCPHSPEGTVAPWNIICDCRKPKVGMIEKLQRTHNIDLKNSFLAGDTWRDIQCAKTLNLKSFGILGGAGFPYPESSPHFSNHPNKMVNSLWEAVQYQLKNHHS